MSLSDTIDAIIKESASVERELRWYLSALPAIVSTEVSGVLPPLMTIRLGGLCRAAKQRLRSSWAARGLGMVKGIARPRAAALPPSAAAAVIGMHAARVLGLGITERKGEARRREWKGVPSGKA